MKLSRLTTTRTGESRFERWRPMPIPPEDGEEIPKLLVKPIPTPLQLFDEWKACLNQEMIGFLLDRQPQEQQGEQGLWDLFKDHLSDPTCVDLDKLALRLARKYYKDWSGITDDEDRPVPFDMKMFLVQVFPVISMWVIEDISQLSAENSFQVQAEKKT